MTSRSRRPRQRVQPYVDDPGELLVAAMQEFEMNVRRWARQVEPGWSPADLDDIGAVVFGFVLRRIFYREVHRDLPTTGGGGPNGTDPYRFRDSHQLGEFLKKTTHNVARNMRRKRNTQAGREQIMATPEDLVSDSPTGDPTDPPGVIDRQEVEDAVVETLASLPSEVRSAFGAHLEGLPQETAAQRLGMKRRTYRDRVKQAQLALERELAKRGLYP